MSVLAKSEIEKRLKKGQIFQRKSWHRDCIRGAAYDLRIGLEYLIAPDGRRYWPNGSSDRQKRRERIVLEPGEVAFVSSFERVCMPLDLAGNVAPKYRLARQGLLVMGGMLVDPGYGLELREGKWVAKKVGERLHFQLANIGEERLTLLPERDSIAGIQFITLKGKAVGKGEDLTDLSIPDSAELLEAMFDRGSDVSLPPLAFFSQTRELETKVEKLEKQCDEQKVKLETTRQATDQLVVFGVFLIAITLFTVAVSALVSALAEGEIEDVVGTGESLDLTLPGLGVAVVLMALVGIVAWKIMQPAVDIVDARRHEDRSGG
jgi:deoxycytidine triphosphate deaminase